MSKLYQYRAHGEMIPASFEWIFIHWRSLLCYALLPAWGGTSLLLLLATKERFLLFLFGGITWMVLAIGALIRITTLNDYVVKSITRRRFFTEIRTLGMRPLPIVAALLCIGVLLTDYWGVIVFFFPILFYASVQFCELSGNWLSRLRLTFRLLWAARFSFLLIIGFFVMWYGFSVFMGGLFWFLFSQLDTLSFLFTEEQLNYVYYQILGELGPWLLQSLGALLLLIITCCQSTMFFFLYGHAIEQTYYRSLEFDIKNF